MINFLGEQAGGPGHQEDEDAERDKGDEDGYADPELRPLDLFFAWHALADSPLRHACTDKR